MSHVTRMNDSMNNSTNDSCPTFDACHLCICDIIVTNALQASDSVALHHYTFPPKVVLLLGKEKEGIPQKLLHLVDTCIEIPQLGMIRSLNVHVSAACCIWQWTQQRLP